MQDLDQGQARRQARRPPRRAEGQRLPRRRADDGRRWLPRRLGARHRRHHRHPHPRRRRRDRRQGGVRILLRVRRQPHELDRPGAESAKARLHHRRLVVRQRGAGRGRRGADGDRRRPGRLDPHSGELLRHRRHEADVRPRALHRHRPAGDHARHRRPDDRERRRQRAAAGGDRRPGRPRLAPASGPACRQIHRGAAPGRQGPAHRRAEGGLRPSPTPSPTSTPRCAPRRSASNRSAPSSKRCRCRSI